MIDRGSHDSLEQLTAPVADHEPIRTPGALAADLLLLSSDGLRALIYEVSGFSCCNSDRLIGSVAGRAVGIYMGGCVSAVCCCSDMSVHGTIIAARLRCLEVGIGLFGVVACMAFPSSAVFIPSGRALAPPAWRSGRSLPASDAAADAADGGTLRRCARGRAARTACRGWILLRRQSRRRGRRKRLPAFIAAALRHGDRDDGRGRVNVLVAVTRWRWRASCGITRARRRDGPTRVRRTAWWYVSIACQDDRLGAEVIWTRSLSLLFGATTPRSRESCRVPGARPWKLDRARLAARFPHSQAALGSGQLLLLCRDRMGGTRHRRIAAYWPINPRWQEPGLSVRSRSASALWVIFQPRRCGVSSRGDRRRRADRAGHARLVAVSTPPTPWAPRSGRWQPACDGRAAAARARSRR